MKRTEIQRKTSMKRTPPKRKPAQRNRKPKTGDWKRWNDELFSLIVRSRGSCARCGTNMRLQCSHIVSRGYLATRWNEANSDCLCLGCHHWWHNKPLEAEAWTLERGIDLQGLKTLALTHKRPDYVETLQRLVERAEELDIDTTKFRKHLP